MPDITFILPHWIYWGGIVFAPAALMFAARRLPSRGRAPVSGPLACFFWAAGGMAGLHRLYLKSWGAAVFIALFVGVIFCNAEAKLARNAHSIAANDVFNAEYDLKRAEDDGEERDVIDPLRRDLAAKIDEEKDLAARLADWRRTAGYVALAILFLLVVDAFLMPRNLRSARARESSLPADDSPPPPPSQAAPGADAFSRAISKLNGWVGEFVSYWTALAVFAFYYEVTARYIFNSPTIWAHESMFLLFGMQYLLAGGYCLRENAHVRVDVLYSRFSRRGRAIADLATSVFFFIFAGALAATGWIFFSDSFAIRQVSHTEWEIAHWPIKFALPLGGALLLAQGVAAVLRDIAILRGGDGN